MERDGTYRCLYPARSAHSTARSTSFGLDSHVPRPTAGILAPVLSVNVFPADMSGAVEYVE